MRPGDLSAPPGGTEVAVEPSFGIVTPVLAFATPAVAELVLFFVTLIFFLAVQMDFRRYMASFFSTRDAKLRFIRISNDVEHILAVPLTIIGLETLHHLFPPDESRLPL